MRHAGPVQVRMDRGNYQLLYEKATQSLAETPYMVVNLVDAKFLDSTAIGSLVGLAKQARDACGELLLAAVPEPIQRTRPGTTVTTMRIASPPTPLRT